MFLDEEIAPLQTSGSHIAENPKLNTPASITTCKTSVHESMLLCADQKHLAIFFYLYSKARSKHGVYVFFSFRQSAYLAYSIYLAYLVNKLREPIRRD